MAVLATPTTPAMREPPKRTITYSRHASFDQRCQVTQALKQVHWETMYKLSYEEQFNFFHDTVSGIINDYLPLKKRVVASNDKPWVTPAFKSLIARRQEAFTTGDTTLYRRLRNQANREAKSLQSQFYQQSVDRLCDGSSKQWWKTVKSLIGKSKRDNSLQNFANSHFNGNIKELSDATNDHFASVSSDLEPLTQPVGNPYSVPDSMIISLEAVEKQLMNIKVTKAPGPDDVPSWILHDLADVLGKPICALFNTSIRESYVPTFWKRADLCPIPKKSPIIDLKKDLRPISLTPILSKLLEQHLVEHIRSATPNIDPTQFGGIKASSTSHALLKIMHPVYKAVDDSKNYARLLLIDFSKAFDHIDHHTLLGKLQANGAPEIVCKWYENFLHLRQQRVKIGTTTSGWCSINGGVPQGTISGPELFVQMVSDIQPTVTNIKYMDDTTLVETIKKSDVSQMQHAADEICTWSSRNKLAINETKTKEMRISFVNQPSLADDITMNDIVMCSKCKTPRGHRKK